MGPHQAARHPFLLPPRPSSKWKYAGRCEQDKICGGPSLKHSQMKHFLCILLFSFYSSAARSLGGALWSESFNERRAGDLVVPGRGPADPLRYAPCAVRPGAAVARWPARGLKPCRGASRSGRDRRVRGGASPSYSAHYDGPCRRTCQCETLLARPAVPSVWVDQSARRWAGRQSAAQARALAAVWPILPGLWVWDCGRAVLKES